MAGHADPLRRRRLVVGVPAWAAFALVWWLVARRGLVALLPELALTAATLLVVSLTTMLWVQHNLRIFQRKGPRRGLPDCEAAWQTDSLGRPLRIAALASNASTVRVVLRDGVKHYEADR